MINNIQELDKQPALAKLLIVLMNNQDKHMSTLDLLENGILSTASGIARLKGKGVLIDTNTETRTDRSGTPHKRMSCYKIVGGATI